jgi:hypothetical protein
VTTQTSEATAAPGASITDKLTVDIAKADGMSAEWGVYGTDGGPYKPVPAVPVATAPIHYLADTGSSIQPQTAGVAAAVIMLGAAMFGFARKRMRSAKASRSARS